MIGTNEPTNYTTEPKPVLVFGASGEQGRAVIEGFIDSGCGGEKYSPVYAFSSHWDSTTNSSSSANKLNDNIDHDQQIYLSDALGCILLTGDIANPEHVRKAIRSTKAQVIFVVTTTEFPDDDNEEDVPAGGGGGGGGGEAVAVVESGANNNINNNDVHVHYHGHHHHHTAAVSPILNAMNKEYDVIIQFFNILKQVSLEESDLKRTVVFSTRVNVEGVYQKYIMMMKKQKKQNVAEKREQSGCTTLEQDEEAAVHSDSFEYEEEEEDWIQPLDDGSIVAHYTGAFFLCCSWWRRRYCWKDCWTLIRFLFILSGF